MTLIPLPSPPILQTLKEIEEEFLEQLFLKAILGNEMVGSVRAYQKENTVHIKRLIVNPNYQNQGIGTKLMESIEELLRYRKI